MCGKRTSRCVFQILRSFSPRKKDLKVVFPKSEVVFPKPKVRSATEADRGFASYIYQFSKKVSFSSRRDDSEVRHSRTKSTLFFRIERCMVQKDNLFGWNTELGSPSVKKRDPFLGLFLVSIHTFQFITFESYFCLQDASWTPPRRLWGAPRPILVDF